jgi:hypothetical protein
MPRSTLTEEGIRAIEKQIDAAFLDTLNLAGVWKSTLRNYAVDMTEELLTGHGTVDESSSSSLTTYSLNVVNGCNVLLRHIEAAGSDTRTPPPRDLEFRMKRAIAAASLYSTVEDAYVSYSHGYATARLSGKNTIRFDPPGGDLDARLRYFGTVSSPSDRMENTKLPPLKLPNLMTKKHGAKVVKTLLNAKLEQMGGLSYVMDETLLRNCAEGFRKFFTRRIQVPMETALREMTLDSVVRAYSMICAAARLHKWVTILSKPEGLDKSVNWPSLWRTEEDWKKMFSLFCPEKQVEALIDLFRFDPSRSDSDITLTPLVELGQGYLAISPTAVLRSNFFRNVLALLIRRFPTVYSTFTSGREKVLSASARKILRKNWLGGGIFLPKWNGQQLPDIDLLLGQKEQGPIVVCEVKRQLSGSSTREVINRDEYLRKGLKQLEAIREFLASDPRFLQSRQLLDRPARLSDFVFILLCKGHLGSETVQSKGILKCDYDVFIQTVRSQGVDAALRLAREHAYLPRLGTDFTMEPIAVRFGRWRLKWWMLLSRSLPADDESKVVLDFYSDSAEFLH